VLVAVSHGSEDIETVNIIDTLRRAEIKVTVGKCEGTGSKSPKEDPLLCNLARETKLVRLF
jgi:hypothetical protein